MPAAPRLVVYWGRWAGAGGEFGPWSETLVTDFWSLSAARHGVKAHVTGMLTRKAIGPFGQAHGRGRPCHVWRDRDLLIVHGRLARVGRASAGGTCC
jgi:hypothetical protein